MELITKEEAQDMMVNAGADPEYGLEYLNGLEIYTEGKTMYRREDVERYINR